MLKYVEIYRSIKDGITNQTYKPDQKLPSVKELMSLYKAGVCTVQHALNMLEKEGLILGVRSQGLFVRNPAEPALYGGKTRRKQIRKVGILLPWPVLMAVTGTRYIHKIVNGIGTVLFHSNVSAYPIDVYHKDIHQVLAEINGLSLDGLICIEMEDKKLVQSVKQMKLPLVHCELVDFKSKDRMVLADHFHGGELLARKLGSLGHKKILFLHGHKMSKRKTDQTNLLRWQGIEAGARATGALCRSEFISMEAGHDAISVLVNKALLKNTDCTGIIAGSGYILDMIRRFFSVKSTSQKEPYDFASYETGFDPGNVGNRPTWICSMNAEAMGTLAANILIGKTERGPRVHFLPMHLDAEGTPAVTA